MTDLSADRQPWHLDKRVPVALIVTIMIQTGAGVWWAATQDQRVKSLEEWRTDSKSVAADLSEIKAEIRSLNRSIDDVKERLRDGKMNYYSPRFEVRPTE